jgi:rod shape determining protein RodA
VRKLGLKIDLITFILAITIGLIGVVLIASAKAQEPGFAFGFQARRQLLILIFGIIAMIIVSQIDYRLLARISWPTYALFLVFLLAVLIFGREIGGSKRWLVIFGFQFQPSEFAKVVVVLALADFLNRNIDKIGENIAILASVGAVLVVTFFVISEPDLGTSLVFIPILLGVLVMGDVSPGGILKVIGIGLASLPLGWLFLKDYQKDRIFSFLNPAHDITGQGYQPYQARIAVGSGGLTGEGLFSGSQNILDMIPGQHTDFIFTVLAEEKGFIGSIILLGLFTALFLRAIQIGYRSNDPLGRMIVGGVLGWLFFEVFVNIGMSLGIMPVTGIPLPMLSYGGSSLVSSLIGIGLIMSVHNYSPKYGRLI